jgi:hypothetical protein
VTLGGQWQPLVAGHVAASGNSTNGDAAATKLPTRRLDQGPIGRPPGSSRSPPTRLGFSPFQFRHPKKGEGGRGGVWGKKAKAMSAASPSTRRSRSNRGPAHRRPFEGAVPGRRREEEGAEQGRRRRVKLPRRREPLHRAGHDYAADPT